MKWINAVGMLLEFISFWFAAPELLGESSLKRFEKGLKNLISIIPILIIFLVISAYGLTFAITGIVGGLKASSEGANPGEMSSFFTVIAICTFLYMILMIFYKKIKLFLEIHLSQKLYQKLINNSEIRKSALIIGGILFSIGFLCQFIAAILD
jgi:hypothetical protein